MSQVVPSRVFLKKQYEATASERFEEENQRLEAHMRANKCTEFITTGWHPEHDTHLCLRKKGHRGYHQDKTTGFSWRWEEE